MPSSSLKILYLITDLNIGGTEKILYELVTRIDQKKFSPIVCGLKSWGYYAEKIKEKGIKVITLNLEQGFWLKKNFQAMFTLVKIMKEERVDFVHTFLFRANFLGRIAASLAGVAKVISSIRVMEEEKKYHLFLEKLTSSLTDKFIVNSEALKNFVLEKIKVPPEKIEVVYNGIDLSGLPKVENKIKRQELGCSEKDILIGTVGRLHKQKGIEYFLEAMKLVTGYRLQVTGGVKFLIAGDGPEGESLKFKVQGLKLEERVKFLGWRKDALEIISILDIFVLPSLWEGTPNVILESLAYAKPTVATKVGGVGEIVEDQVSGLLVEPASVQALADAIIWVLKNPEKAKEMGNKGKEKVEKFFPIDKMVRETEEIYAESMKKTTLSGIK